MKNMKKSYLIIWGLFLLLTTRVSAKEIFYTNNNNVSFTKEEYDFVSQILFNGYQESMSKVEYDEMFKDDTLHGKRKIFHSDYNDLIMPLTLKTVATSYKTLSMESACNNGTCLIIIKLEWTKSPNTRSYDIIGARLEDTSLTNTPITKVFSGSNFTTFMDVQKFTNGFGVSVKLPSSDGKLSITQTFRVKDQGSIYGSYQHAIENVSLTDSKKYTISFKGYGDVFLFDTTDLRNSYDAMSGVSFVL